MRWEQSFHQDSSDGTPTPGASWISHGTSARKSKRFGKRHVPDFWALLGTTKPKLSDANFFPSTIFNIWWYACVVCFLILGVFLFSLCVSFLFFPFSWFVSFLFKASDSYVACQRHTTLSRDDIAAPHSQNAASQNPPNRKTQTVFSGHESSHTWHTATHCNTLQHTAFETRK